MHLKPLAAFAVLSLCVSCDPIDNAIDCDAICNRYKTCFDADYDVPACAARCRSDANTDRDYERKVDRCSACIDDQACTSATFSCAGDCGTIVP